VIFERFDFEHFGTRSDRLDTSLAPVHENLVVARLTVDGALLVVEKIRSDLATNTSEAFVVETFLSHRDILGHDSLMTTTTKQTLFFGDFGENVDNRHHFVADLHFEGGSVSVVLTVRFLVGVDQRRSKLKDIRKFLGDQISRLRVFDVLKTILDSDRILLKEFHELRSVETMLEKNRKGHMYFSCAI